MIFRSKSGS